MDHLWSPWRYRYIAEAGRDSVCVFCRMQAQPERDAANFVLHRGKTVFLVLNLFPYTTGHMMVVPNEHTPSLLSLDRDATSELLDLAKKGQQALEDEYKPDGFNIGMNIGKAAGAGIEAHLHLHIVPRWAGDANFVSIVGETRVMPEDLPSTYQKLKARLA